MTTPPPPSPLPVVSFQSTPAEQRAINERYCRNNTIAISLILQITSLCMGSTIRELDTQYNTTTADVDDRKQILDELEEQQKQYQSRK
jgi:hypothetical protein